MRRVLAVLTVVALLAFAGVGAMAKGGPDRDNDDSTSDSGSLKAGFIW